MSRHDLTFNGGMQISTAQKKFGNSSWLFDGSNDYVSMPDSADWAFGAGDFTMETWVSFNGVSTSQMLFNHKTDGNNELRVFYYVTNSTLRCSVYSGGSEIVITGPSWVPIINTWYHVAVVRSGSTFTLYVNGTSLGSAATYAGSLPDYSGTFDIGMEPTGGGSAYPLNGYLDEIRISKGIARWTANFTPPDQPYVADQYTMLLCHCEADMLGTGAHSMTTVGTPKMVAVAPTANYGGSLEFNGTTDVMTVPYSADFDVTTGDFTVDCWIKTGSNTVTIFNTGRNSGAWAGHAIQLSVNSSGKLYGELYAVGSLNFSITGGTTVNNNGWHHVAFVRAGTSIYLYVDGISDASPTSVGTASVYVTGYTLKVGADEDSAGTGYLEYLAGNIAGLRISKGLARWTANFTPPNAPYSKAIGGIDGYTKLMLHFDKGNNSAIFEDSSLTPKNISTGAGAPIQKSDQMMFGRSCLYLNGSSKVNIAEHADLSFGTGDFTIDFWTKSSGAIGGLVTTFTGSSTGWFIEKYNDGLFVSRGGTNVWFTVGTFTSAWAHVALVRQGTTLSAYIDGTLVGSTTNSAAWNTSGTGLAIGSQTVGNNSDLLTGYIDELRISKGIARWTTNFTPPTKPYDTPVVDSYTKLLLPMNGTNGSTLFPDKGVTGHTVTAIGTAVTSTTAYKFNGSSGYFATINDYLSVPDSADFSLDGDFTIESWIRFNVVSAGAIYSKWADGNNLHVFTYSTGYGLELFYKVAASTVLDMYRAWTPVANTWYHVAIIRTGSTLRMFVDGIQLGADGTYAGTISSGGPVKIARCDSNLTDPFNGYMQDVRVSKGIARWIANFAPPARPYGS